MAKQTEQWKDYEKDECEILAELIKPWSHLGHSCAVGEVSGEATWWIVVHPVVVVRDEPSVSGKILGLHHRGDAVFCQTLQDAWIQIDTKMLPPVRDENIRNRRFQPMAQSETGGADHTASSTWMMWDGEEKGLGLLLQPLVHLVAMTKYPGCDVKLPREAVTWDKAEVNMFLGSGGQLKPGRESSLLRASKRLVRSVRGGACGLHYRVDDAGQGGIFSLDPLVCGTPVEVCPLLEVNKGLRDKSDVLRRITVAMQNAPSRVAIVLGFGMLYKSSKKPNIHWSYHSESQLVLWAAQDVHIGTELTINFAAPARPLVEAKPLPKSWQAPISTGGGKLETAGYVVHGESTIHGLGVFATRDLKAGQLLECCPAVIMDEGCAYAMHNYRWGSETNFQGDYYLPLGLGCLYNHSEKPHVQGKLDVNRGVLEFHLLTDIAKGQEVFTNYGEKYFDEDFAGHRKSELLSIAAPSVSADPREHKLLMLLNALIHAWSSNEFIKGYYQVARGIVVEKSEKYNVRATKKHGAKVKRAHEHVLDAQLSILERFGYSRDGPGALHMQADVESGLRDFGENPEIVQNCRHVHWLSHRYHEPPPWYRENMNLQLTLLGTEESLSVLLPSNVRCAFVKYVLARRFPHETSFASPDLLLVRRFDQSWRIYQDHDAVPDDRILWVRIPSLVEWPDNDSAGAGDDVDIVVKMWEHLNEWLYSGRGGGRDFARWMFDYCSFKIAGTWDDFQCNDMLWDGIQYAFVVTVGRQGWESFQILLDGKWEQTIYPNVKDACQFVDHQVVGPDDKGHGLNWTIGKHEKDRSDPGCRYKVQLSVGWYGFEVRWFCLGADLRADEAVESIRKQTSRANEERMKKQAELEEDLRKVRLSLASEYKSRRVAIQKA